ncbi:MAG TPA: ATPase [Elusimicrobia bacterium]|nr:MAG: ATPase [Elusimicrobia bacterium GWF2_62_30]HBA59368.1 ATPase [Elusimicrobiota bacterium]
MIHRPYWENRIKSAWGKAPIVWLSGVRRCGKTTLAKMLFAQDSLYLNCDLPSVGEMTADPELFFSNCEKPVVVFDEIHQLKDPSRLLKIGADMFPELKILATGSSTLAAGKKFRDTLTGRKRQVHLSPVLYSELPLFNKASLSRRLLHGGLPPALLAAEKDPSFYREWSDSFFSRDIQKLFGFRDAEKFNLLFEYLMRQSGGAFDCSKTASALGISRPTIDSHLAAMEITGALRIVRPFFGGGRKEMVKIPKIFGFDTGFVSFFRGWNSLRPSDNGTLWEHLALDWLAAENPESNILYWRDKAGRELDFIIAGERDEVDVFECKWSPAEFCPDALKVFREAYPKGKNYLICPVPGPFKKREGGFELNVRPPVRES